MNENFLTEFGCENKEKIGEIATLILNDFQKENGKQIFKYFVKEFNLQNLKDEDFILLKKYFPNEEKFLESKKFYEEKEKEADNPYYGITLRDYVFAPFKHDDLTNHINDPKYQRIINGSNDNEIYIPLIVVEALKNEIKRIFRESENIYREERGVPRVGEGWISETELYYKIRDSFPNEKIVQHGSSSWLGRQHLDIYFPKRNIGIEYQGDQHYEPIEHFGGKKGFEYRKELDIRKEKLCKENNCVLIYVYPDYDFNEVKIQIEKLIANKH